VKGSPDAAEVALQAEAADGARISVKPKHGGACLPRAEPAAAHMCPTIRYHSFGSVAYVSQGLRGGPRRRLHSGGFAGSW